MVKIKKCFFVIFLLSILYFFLNIEFAKVDGESMQPTLNNNDIVIYKRNIKNIKRFDIVIFKFNNSLFIKRVIGLPGEKIEYRKNNLYVNGEEVSENFKKSVTSDLIVDLIPSNEIFVLVDNRIFSSDSRDFGSVKLSDVKGIMILRLT